MQVNLIWLLFVLIIGVCSVNGGDGGNSTGNGTNIEKNNLTQENAEPGLLGILSGSPVSGSIGSGNLVDDDNDDEDDKNVGGNDSDDRKNSNEDNDNTSNNDHDNNENNDGSNIDSDDNSKEGDNDSNDGENDDSDNNDDNDNSNQDNDDGDSDNASNNNENEDNSNDTNDDDDSGDNHDDNEDNSNDDNDNDNGDHSNENNGDSSDENDSSADDSESSDGDSSNDDGSDNDSSNDDGSDADSSDDDGSDEDSSDDDSSDDDSSDDNSSDADSSNQDDDNSNENNRRSTKSPKPTRPRPAGRPSRPTRPDGINHYYKCSGKAEIWCPRRSAIRILKANYGRSSSNVCTNNKSYQKRCHNPQTTRELEKMCNGKDRCELNVNNRTLSDCCPRTNKYLDIYYKCETPKNSPSPKAVTVNACKGESLELACPNSHRIEILRANYGRTDSLTYHDIKKVSTNCIYKPTKLVANACNDTERCVLTNYANKFENSCPGVSKCLSVTYRCFNHE